MNGALILKNSIDTAFARLSPVPCPAVCANMQRLPGGKMLPFQIDSFKHISHARTPLPDDQLVCGVSLLHDIKPCCGTDAKTRPLADLSLIHISEPTSL